VNLKRLKRFKKTMKNVLRTWKKKWEIKKMKLGSDIVLGSTAGLTPIHPLVLGDAVLRVIGEKEKKRCKKMKNKLRNILKDEGGQGAAEYILLFGGVLVIIIVAFYIYMTYFSSGTAPLTYQNDVKTLRQMR
jgi:Flp pilus assembly pilin Flp